MQEVPKQHESVFPARLQSLCKAASVEQDPAKLLELVRQINRLFDDRLNRIATEKQDEGQEPARVETP
jgi:hypothetical protein